MSGKKEQPLDAAPGKSPETGQGKENKGRPELEECEKKAAEYLAGWQRARADLLNYKKEEMERIGELINYAGQEMVLKILPILDNFDLAVTKLPDDLRKDDNVKGLLQIRMQLRDFLKGLGLEEIKTTGEKFDVNLMEAVGEIDEKDGESGTIVSEIQKGYKINGRLLRPAKVKVIK